MLAINFLLLLWEGLKELNLSSSLSIFNIQKYSHNLLFTMYSHLKLCDLLHVVFLFQCNFIVIENWTVQTLDVVWLFFN